MGRSTGVFPRNIRLDIDPAKWPDNYYDRSYQCTECGENWPHTHLFSAKSMCCDANTQSKKESPSMRWPDAVFSLLSKRFDRFYDEYNEGITDDELGLNPEEIAEGIERLITETQTSLA